MPRGRQPQPTALRMLNGEHRPSHLNMNEPVAVSDATPPPDDLPDAVKAVWIQTLKALTEMHIAKGADVDSLRCYCEAVVTHQKASAVLAHTEILVQGLNGGLMKNPALQVQRDAAHTVRAFAQEFGLTPSARARIEVKADAPALNPFAGG